MTAKRSISSGTRSSQPGSIIGISIPTRHPARATTDRPESLPRLSERGRHTDRGSSTARTLAAALLTIVTDLKARGIAFRSLTEQMDTTMPHGELLFSLFGALAQYERALTRERVMAGLAAGKRRGRQGGRPPMIDAETLERITAALMAGPARRPSAGPSRCRVRPFSARLPGSAGPHRGKSQPMPRRAVLSDEQRAALLALPTTKPCSSSTGH
jgi:hypothetical protein